MKEKKNKSAKRLWWKQHSSLLGLLIFSIILAVTIVACTKNTDNITPAPDVVTVHPGGITGTNGTAGNIAGFVFKELGKGALRPIAEMGMGWVLGAFGLSQQDDATEEEIADALSEIESQLTEVNTNLTTMINELDAIEADLEQLNCSSTLSELDDEVSRVRTLIKQHYNPMVGGGTGGTAPSESIMTDFVNEVLNGSNQEKGIEDILSSFETVIWNRVDGGIMTLCLKSGIMPHPAAGTFGDTLYYNQISALTDYYYGYYVNALLLYTEAKNYLAWQTAYNNGLIDSTFATSNVNTICAINDGNIQYYCNQTISELNDTYGSLKTMFTRGGAPYTNDYQVTQNDPTKPTLWAASIEDFNEDAGAGCDVPEPYGVAGNPSLNGCGPCVGHYNTSLNHTTYRNTTAWEFANKDDLVKLIDPDSAASSYTIGSYLESKGFKYLSGTAKVVQAYNSPVSVAIDNAGLDLEVIPFFYAGFPIWPGIKAGVFYTSAHFNVLLNGTSDTIVYSCGKQGEYAAVMYNYTYPWGAFADDPNDNWYAEQYWFWAYAYGGACQYHGSNYSFDWQYQPGHTYDYDWAPGWLKSRHDAIPSSVRPIWAFLWPIKRLPSTLCTDSRSSTNKGGMPTMCGDDFTAWLNIVLPPPPGQ